MASRIALLASANNYYVRFGATRKNVKATTRMRQPPSQYTMFTAQQREYNTLSHMGGHAVPGHRGSTSCGHSKHHVRRRRRLPPPIIKLIYHDLPAKRNRVADIGQWKRLNGWELQYGMRDCSGLIVVRTDAKRKVYKLIVIDINVAGDDNTITWDCGVQKRPTIEYFN